MPRLFHHDIVRTVLGLLLLTAAFLKGHELSTEPMQETSLLTSRWFLVGLVELELALGVWLLSGFCFVLTRCLALAFFVGVAAVSLSMALSGETACGCFGKVPVNPWHSLAIDLAAIVALVRWRPRFEGTLLAIKPLHLLVLLFVVLLVGIPSGIVMNSYAPSTLTGDGRIVGKADSVVLHPEDWVGKPLPLVKHVDIGNQLLTGQWIIVLYRHDCPICKREIAKYEGLANISGGASPRVALVEVPRYGSSKPNPASGASAVSAGRVGVLRDTNNWFVAVPVVLRTDHGIVISVSRPR